MNAVDELNALLGIGPPKPRLPITLQRSGYDSIKILGKGSFGQAYLIFHKNTNKYFVAKHVNMAKMDQRARKEARNEIAILQQLKHPNVVRYEESVEQGQELYIVMEYADGGDLYSYINKVKASGAMMTEDQVLNLFVQCAMAIKYMHDRKVIHRDIKPQNVFLTKGRVVKLGDFGISTVLNHTMAMAKTLCGTPCYFSPELCDSRPYNNKSDVWALGVMLYEMASFELPFDSPNMKRLMDDIRHNKPARKRSFSDGLWSLIDMMLTKDPLKRPDMDGVLAHPTVTKAMPRIAKLLAESTLPVSQSGLPMAPKEDDPMMAMWRQKREREQREAASKLGAPLPPVAGARVNAAKLQNTPTALGTNINNPGFQPTPPPAPPAVQPARADSNPSSANAHNNKGPAYAMPGAGGANGGALPNPPPPQSAAAIERSKREEEYSKLREEMARIEENRRLRMEKERKQEAVVDEQLKKREELVKKQQAAEAAEAELRRAEAIRLMKEKEAREQQAAAEARAALQRAKQQRDEQEALLDQQRQAATRAVAAREAREKAELARKLAEKEHQAVMMAESPTAHHNRSNQYEDDFVEPVIEDETEDDSGINAVIRNMNTFHERSVTKRRRAAGGADDDIDDEVGPVSAAPTSPLRKPHNNNKVQNLNDDIIDEVSNHTFEDPMGTRVNVEEIQLTSPLKGAGKPLNGSGAGAGAELLGAPAAEGFGASTSRSPTVNRSLQLGDEDDGDDPIQGSCLCGRVEYRGYISYIYGSFTCTCNLCKRFTGSTLGVSWLHLPAVIFPEVVKPSDALRNYGLGDGTTHCYFCRKCGSSIAMEHPGVDGCVISKASLDEKSMDALSRNQRTAR